LKRKLTIVILTAVVLFTVVQVLFTEHRGNVRQISCIYNYWHSASDIVVDEGYAYAATGASGLQIADISDPDDIEIVGYYDDNPGEADHVAISDGHAYLISSYLPQYEEDDENRHSSLEIIDISNRDNPDPVSELKLESEILSISLTDEYLFFTVRHYFPNPNGPSVGGLMVIDISDPAEPEIAGRYSTYFNPHNIQVMNDVAYFLSDNQGTYIFILDVSDVEGIREISTYEQNLDGNSMLALSDTLILVTIINDNDLVDLMILDASDPEELDSITIARLDAEGVIALAVGDGFAYLATNDSSLIVMDISDPTEPEESARIELPAAAVCLTVENGTLLFGYPYLYNGDNMPIEYEGERGIHVMDIENPEEPEEIGSYLTNGIACEVQVVGDYAYLAAGPEGFRIIDVSDSIRPVEIASFIPEGGDIRLLHVVEDYAYLADWSFGLRVVDISDLDNLEEIGLFEIENRISTIQVEDDYAFIGTTRDGFIVDVSHPAEPALSYETGDNWDCLYVDGLNLYVINSRVLTIFDILSPEEPEELGETEIESNALDFVVEGDYAFISGQRSVFKNTTAGYFQVIDVSDSENPEAFNVIPFESVGNSIYVSRGCAFIAEDDWGILVYDVTSPEHPIQLGYFDTPGVALGIYEADGLVYVADYTNLGIYFALGVGSIEASADSLGFGVVHPNSTRDLILSITNTGDADLTITDIEVAGNEFSCDFENEVSLEPDEDFEITVSFAPEEERMFSGELLISTDEADAAAAIVDLGGYGHRGVLIETPGSAQDVFVNESYAYVADGGEGLFIVDVSEPVRPDSASRIETYGEAFGVFVLDDYAYVADYSDGLYIINVSDPENPDSMGRIDPFGTARDVFVDGDYTYLACGGTGLYIIDVSEPRDPEVVGYFDDFHNAYGVFVVGDFAYVVARDDGFQIINVSEPAEPSLVSSLDTQGLALGIFVESDYAYVADSYSGLCIIDVSDPENPVVVSSFDTQGEARDVFVANDFAFVAEGPSGGGMGGEPSTPGNLIVLDVANPAMPFQVDSYWSWGSLSGVFVDGDHAYVTDSQVGMFVIDVSELAHSGISVSSTSLDFGAVHPDSTEELTLTISNAGDAELTLTDILIEGDGFSSDFGNEVSLDPEESFDLTVTFAPEEQGTFPGELTIETDEENVVIVPVSLHGMGHRGTHIATPGYARDVHVDGGYAYVANYGTYNGLFIVDVSDPEDPDSVSSFNTPGYVWSIYVSDDLAYVTNYGNYNGILIFDVSEPENPDSLGSLDLPYYALDVFQSGDYAYVADYTSGLCIVNVSEPNNPEEVSVFDTPGSAYDVFVVDTIAYVADMAVDCRWSMSPIRKSRT